MIRTVAVCGSTEYRTFMKIALIIPAAGTSSRYGANRSKLAEDLGGRPVLLRTVELFNKRPEVHGIIVAGPPDNLEEFKFRFGDQLAFHGATVVSGGQKHRWETVRNALEAIPDDATHVAIHDAARPGTPADLIDRVFEAAATFDAVIPAIDVTATIKRVSEKAVDAREVDPIAAAILGDDAGAQNSARAVVETLDRRGLVEVQTPQAFEVDLIRRAFAQSDCDGVTDDASLVERLGEPVHVVAGDVANIKITTPGDMRLIRAVLGIKPPRERPIHQQF